MQNPHNSKGRRFQGEWSTPGVDGITGGVICARSGSAKFNRHLHSLHANLSNLFTLTSCQNLLQTRTRRDIQVLIHIKEEGPVGKRLSPQHAIVEHGELVVRTALINLQELQILHAHPTQLNPRLQYRQHVGRHSARVVEQEVRAVPEHHRMVRHPLPNPIRAHVAVESGSTECDLVGEWGGPPARVVLAWPLYQRFERLRRTIPAQARL